MGAWGPKVFDTDSACDQAGDVATRLIGTVEENLQKLERECYVDDIVMSTVAMLCALGNKISTFRYSISKARAIRWQTIYLAWFDANYPNMVDQDELEAFRVDRLSWLARLAEIAE